MKLKEKLAYIHYTFLCKDILVNPHFTPEDIKEAYMKGFDSAISCVLNLPAFELASEYEENGVMIHDLIGELEKNISNLKTREEY